MRYLEIDVRLALVVWGSMTLLACSQGDLTDRDGGTVGADAASTLDGGPFGQDGQVIVADAGVFADVGPSSDDAAVELDATPAVDAGTGGCGRIGVPTGLSSVDTTVAGLSRRYQVFVPASYDANTPMRVVLTFHGLGGDGDQIRSYLSLEGVSAGQAIIVYPDGRVIPGVGRTAWEEADLAFVDAMLTELEAAYCVDPSRVFALGHSYGAYMTNLVGCQRGNVVRAIAPLSGGTLGGSCRGPVAVWLAHGTTDPTVPQSEGIAARDHWRGINGCSATTVPTDPAPCVSYEGCAAKGPITWCSFTGGHFPLPAYTQSAIWDFFRVL